MAVSRWPMVLLAALLAAGVADVATTTIGLGAGFGESSAWASSWYGSMGPAGLGLQKAIVTWAVWAVAGAIPGRLGGPLLGWGTAAVTTVAAGRNLTLLVAESGWLTP